MFLTVKLNRQLSFPALVFFLLTAGLLFLLAHELLAGAPAAAPEGPARLVIDPGHGGVDGGAISIGGAKESELNLAIGLKLEKLAQLYGCDALMTRREDRGVLEYGPGEYSEHKELARRTEIANGEANGVLVSIHQNVYPTAQPSGAQVLYAGGESSKTLGLLTQNNLVRYLDPQNRRVATPGDRVYQLSHAEGPAILVECGFISNFAELEKLQSEDYQMSLAAVLLLSYLQYTTGTSLT